MDFKFEIQKLLKDLKTFSVDRREAEKRLGYAEYYIDQALSKGGNSKLFNSLKILLINIDKSNAPRETSEIQTLNEPDHSYQKKRLDLKNGADKRVPVYGGYTTLGNIEVLDDDNMKHRVVAELPGEIFPGCNYSEKAKELDMIKSRIFTNYNDALIEFLYHRGSPVHLDDFPEILKKMANPLGGSWINDGKIMQVMHELYAICFNFFFLPSNSYRVFAFITPSIPS